MKDASGADELHGFVLAERAAVVSAWQNAPIVDDAEATPRAAAWEDAPIVEGEAASWEQAPIIEDAGGPVTRAARRAAESAALPTGEPTDTEPRQPEARDLSTGFFNNLGLRDIRRTMRERGAAPSLVRYFSGATQKEQERRRKLAGMDVDPIDREFGEALEAAYQAGGYESPDFQRIEAAHKEYLKARDNPEFRWSDLKAAFAEDPGGLAAEFVKTMIADPELLLTPLGWGRAATAAGTAAKAAGAGRALTQTARAAGGFTGAAATGAAVTAPVSVAQQLGESGTVDASRLGGETALGAAGSATAGGTLVGAAAAIKRLLALRTRPNVDAGQVDAEMQRLQDAAVQEARNAGMTPEQAQAELSRLLDDPALRETAPDATQAPEWARAPEVEGSGRPEDVMPDTTEPGASPERRRDVATRKRVAEMSQEELQRELLTDTVTGLPNRRAYEESEKKPVQAAIDADSLKFVNDTLGHEAGDNMLQAIGQALREQFGDDAAHLSGDEFIVQGVDQATLEQGLAAVAERLDNAEFVAELPDGTTVTKKGVHFSHGIGATRNEADRSLNKAKAEREAKGLRAARGETPPGVTRVAPGKQASQDQPPAHQEVTNQTASAIDEAAHESATSPRNDLPEPTEAQKEAGNYRKAHIRLHGLEISIENPAGSRRRPEWSPLTRHYGYIKGTRGRDKDHLDVFIGKNADDESLPVFVIDQVDPRTGRFDEHKIHLGEPNKQAARDAYLSNYEPGWKGLGGIKEFTVDEFKDWLERGDTTKPLTLKPGSKVGDRSVGAAEAPDITPQTRLGDAVDAITEPLGKLGKEVADVSGAKAITYLDDLARVSPAAKKLRDTIEYTEFSREPLPPSFYERVSLKTGEYMSAVENTLDSVRGTFRRKLPGDINAKLAGALRGERVGGPVSEAAQRIRVVLNKVRDYARESGLEIGFIKNYFPRVYKKRVLESEPGRTAFTKVLMRHGIEATEADLIAQKIANNDGILALERAPASERVNPTRPAETTSFEPGRLGAQKARINRNLETGRTLARIPDTELAPFLEGNVPAVLNRYITHAVRRAEYARAFGPGEGRLNRMVRDIIVEAAQAGRPVRPAEIQRIYDLADALQQSYRPILSGTGRAANNFVTAYQYMRTLSLATISSLSEPFLVIARGRPGTIPRAIARSLDHAVRESVRSVYRRLPKAEATKALEDVGLGLDAALTERLTASFGGEVTKFTSAYFKLNFLHQFTRFNRVLANEAGKLMVERHLRDLARGVSTRRAAQITRELAELGVDAEAGQAWVRRGARPGDAFYERVKAAGLRFTNEVVMNPRPTNRPMWMSNPHFHLLAQLKGFQTVFGNTVLKRLYDMLLRRGAYEGVRNAAKIAAAGTLMVYTAMLGNELREIIKYGPGGNPRFRDETPARKVYRAMERAGFLGVFQFASDAMFAHRFGSPAIAQLAGPTASQANEIIEAAGKASAGNMRPLAREAANAAPIVNVVPAARHAITDAIAPKTRRDNRRERR